MESITFSDRPRGADFFLGNSLPRARKSARDLKVGGVLSGVLVQEESLSWVHRRPLLREETLGSYRITGDWEAQGGYEQKYRHRNVNPHPKA